MAHDHWTSTVGAAAHAERLRALSEGDYLDDRPDPSEYAEPPQRRRAERPRLTHCIGDPWTGDGTCGCRLPGCPENAVYKWRLV